VCVCVWPTKPKPTRAPTRLQSRARPKKASGGRERADQNPTCGIRGAKEKIIAECAE